MKGAHQIRTEYKVGNTSSIQVATSCASVRQSEHHPDAEDSRPPLYTKNV